MLIRLFRFIKRAKLRTKLFVNFITVALLPILILSYLSYTIAKDSLRDQMNSRAADYADRVGSQLDIIYSRFQEAMDYIVYGDDALMLVRAFENNRIQAGELRMYADQQTNLLKQVSQSIRSVDFLLAGDAGLNFNNRELADKVDKGLDADPQNRKQLSEEGAFWISTEDTLYAVRTIPDLYSNRIAARMVVTINKQAFFTEAFPKKENDFGIIIADRTGGSVFNKVKSVMTSGILPISFLEQAKNNFVTYNGAQYLYRFYQPQITNWKLYVIISYDYVIQRTNSIIKVSVSSGVAGVILIALFSYLLSSNFAGRIEFLIKQMKKVSQGDLLIETQEITEMDEIGQLNVVFENMVSKLDMLIHDVYESKIAQRESEFKALQSQINPHFLYNCLDNLNWRAIMRGDDYSSYLITQLSDYYRTSLNKGQNVITIRDEIRNAVAYMNLQLDLHDHSFRFEKEIDEGLDEQLITINLMLQPLLENAVKHGVDKDQGTDKLIRLTVKDAGDSLVFHVFNTGSSITEETLNSVFVEKTRGYGIRNVNERLKLLFGEEYGIRIRAVDGGTLCTIIIPKATGKMEEQP